MFRFSCRGNVKRIACWVVVLLIAIEVIMLTMRVGKNDLSGTDIDDVSENDEVNWSVQKRTDPPASESGEQIWPYRKHPELYDEAFEADVEIWPFPKQWSSGVDEIDNGDEETKEEKKPDDLERDDELDTDLDDEDEDEDLEDQLDKLDDDDVELKLQKKTLDAKEGSKVTNAKQTIPENTKPLTHNDGDVGIPAKHTATQTKESKSKAIDAQESGKTTDEEENENDRMEDFSDDEAGTTAENPSQITTTSNQKFSSDDRIYVDTSRLVVNPHPFKYLINPTDVCKGSKVFLFCYVHSPVESRIRREIIRRTWARRKNYPGIEIRVAFFVGQPRLDTTEGRRIQEDLLVESRKRGDIVQEDFLDVKGNLSHKSIGALKWIATYCNHTEYVLKTDDDMFVNMYVILNHLQNLHAQNFRNRLILCYVYWRIEVGTGARAPRDRFRGKFLPPYCSGMGFVVTRDVALAFHEVSPYIRFYREDEIFIGGVLPAALNGAVNHTSWARTYCAEYEMGIYSHSTEWYKYTFTHTHNDKLIVKTWKRLSNIVKNHTIPRPSVIRPGLLADQYKPLIELFHPS